MSELDNTHASHDSDKGYREIEQVRGRRGSGRNKKAAVQLSQQFAASPVVIVGGGPVGIRCAQLLLDTNPTQEVVVYDQEPSLPYNRVNLSAYLAGQVSRESLVTRVVPKILGKYKQHGGCRIVQIDSNQRLVVDEQGRRQPYSKLILATGSRPKLPPIAGLQADCIFTLRTIADADRLLALKQDVAHLVVIGGGLLGIETAVALKDRRLQVTVIAPFGLLDPLVSDEAAAVAADYLSSLGIQLVLGVAIEAVVKYGKQNRVLLVDGQQLTFDAALVATGTRPNIELAQQTGLTTANGVLVDEFMRTSDHNIYAVGECAEHNGRLYGFVAPGFEQAKHAVDHINGTAVPYAGSYQRAELKVLKQSVLISGVTDRHSDELTSIRYVDRLSTEYHQIFFRGAKPVGFVSIGKWQDAARLQDIIFGGKKLRFWQRSRFKKTGHLWSESTRKPIADMPEDYIVCLCNNVTCGDIARAKTGGCASVESIGIQTSAGTNCGSCRFMINEMLQRPERDIVIRHQFKVLALSLLSAVGILLYSMLPPIPFAESVQHGWSITQIWLDSFWKQLSGYGLLLAVLAASTLSLRKRAKKISVGHFDDWRFLHIALGAMAVGLLYAHTGMRLGENLNRMLMITFLLAALTGAGVGVLMAGSGRWPEFKLQKYRRRVARLHYTLLWVLPSLLLCHIVAVYYF